MSGWELFFTVLGVSRIVSLLFRLVFAVAFFQPAIHLSARFGIKPDSHLFF